MIKENANKLNTAQFEAEMGMKKAKNCLDLFQNECKRKNQYYHSEQDISINKDLEKKSEGSYDHINNYYNAPKDYQSINHNHINNAKNSKTKENSKDFYDSYLKRDYNNISKSNMKYNSKPSNRVVESIDLTTNNTQNNHNVNLNLNLSLKNNAFIKDISLSNLNQSVYQSNANFDSQNYASLSNKKHQLYHEQKKVNNLNEMIDRKNNHVFDENFFADLLKSNYQVYKTYNERPESQVLNEHIHNDNKILQSFDDVEMKQKPNNSGYKLSRNYRNQRGGSYMKKSYNQLYNDD